jgi:hypothetical protein
MKKPLRLYIWEGHGISNAYHDDGTLAVLAESAEAAREVARAERLAYDLAFDNWREERDRAFAEFRATDPAGALPGWVAYFWRTPLGEDLQRRCPPIGSDFWDGDIKAIDREPDTVIRVDKPGIVVWNGGGYD